MRTLVVFLAIAFSVPAYAPLKRWMNSCDATVNSCMPVIIRSRVLMVSV